MTDEQARRYLFLTIMAMWIIGGMLAFSVLMELQDNKDEKVIRPLFAITAIAAWIAYTLLVFYFSQNSMHIITTTAVIIFLVLLPAALFSMSTSSIIISNL